ncbi:phage minor tail protein G [Vibrio sp. La 4.2.2]|uniref:phage minor tail protein G n=1 Tax=Vibrio sp. La 4.2.2 TaxID=2998830 RepID=UPI0022CDE547|nr:phage minor tail protein G [Vibrio sp. La 4.2.2]MDA0107824.1 phage minor tail protein G [Vibrio sp. La 4.2.2]
MTLLNTAQLTVGSRAYTLSEFTALDRIRDLEHAVGHQPVPLNDDATTEQQQRHIIQLERMTLDNMAHSLALSLSHTSDDSVAFLENLVKTEWPQRAFTTAYDMLTELNKGEDVANENVDEVALGKRWIRLGRWRTIWPWN